jgi:UDP-glucose 4-epimerase
MRPLRFEDEACTAHREQIADIADVDQYGGSVPRRRARPAVELGRHPLNVLITGGAGYIGRFCVRELVAAGHAVVILDRRPADPAATSNVPSVTGDIGDTALVDRLLGEHRIEAVLHLAAEKSVEESMAAPGRHLLNNVGGSLRLLEAMLARGVRRMVFSSSAAVYGTPSEVPVDEGAPLAPDNPYGAGKAMVEQALGWYAACHGFSAVSLRYFNAGGAAADGSLGDDAEAPTNLIPRVMRAVAGIDPAVPVYGTDYETPDGTAIRDYVHVEDLARAHARAVDVVFDGGGHRAYNLGTGAGVTVAQLLDAAERVTGKRVPRVMAERRPGDPPAVWANPSAAARDLGWEARLGLDDILRSAWLWQQRLAAAQEGVGRPAGPARPGTADPGPEGPAVGLRADSPESARPAAVTPGRAGDG